MRRLLLIESSFIAKTKMKHTLTPIDASRAPVGATAPDLPQQQPQHQAQGNAPQMVQRDARYNNTFAPANLLNPVNPVQTQTTPILPLISPQTEANYQLAIKQRDWLQALALANVYPSLLNLPDAEGFTLLMTAARLGNTDCVKTVMRLSTACVGEDSGVPFQQKAMFLINALILAACHGHAEAVNALLAGVPQADRARLALMANRQGWTALMVAARYGHAEAIYVLLTGMPQPDRVRVARGANGQGWTALMIAGRQGHAHAIDALLAGVPQPDRTGLARMTEVQGGTALMIAARYGHADAIEALLAGVPVADRAGLARMADGQGWTALMIAARYRYVDVVDTLLVAVPQPEGMLQMTTLQGRNALMLGAIGGQPQVLTALLEAVEDKDEFAQQTAHGISALRLAVLNHNVDAAVALLKGVANPFALLAQEGPDGLTALQFAGNMSVSYLSALRQAAGLESAERM